MKKQYLPYLQLALILIVLLLPMLSMAQPASNPFNSSTSDPDSAPIDGGLSLLVAAGVGYGAKKLKEKRKNKLFNHPNKKCQIQY